MIVVDSNVIAYFYLPGEFTSLAEEIMKKDSHWIVPGVWRYEFNNILANHVKYKKTPLKLVLNVLKNAQKILIENEFMVLAETVIELAVKHKHSSYDCEFIALAMNKNVRLVTCDKKLATTFPETAIHAEYFIKPDQRLNLN